MEPIDLKALLRARLRDLDVRESLRIFHGRGRCYQGLEFLTIDLFWPVVHITLYRVPGDRFLWSLVSDIADLMIEASLRGAIREQLKSIIAAVPSATAGCPIQSKEVDQTVCNQGIFETIHLQFRDGRSTHTLRLGHPLPSPHYAIEAGLRFKIDLQRNQNIGLFLDMKPARAWLRSNCERKKVLNLFAYTCAFSVVALKGEAERVVNIDMSTSSLAWGLENHRLNQLDSRAAVFLSHEIFRSWGKIRQYAPYDIIIIDPPSFQPGSFVAEKDYPRIVKRIDDVLSRDGAVIMALNSPKLGPDFIRDLLKVHLPALSVERDFDLPDYFSESNPERELKVVLCRAKPA